MQNNYINLFKIFSYSPNAILVTDSEAKIVYANSAWEKLTGYTLDEVRGANPKILQSGKTPRSYYKKLWNSLTKGDPYISEDVIDKRKDGSLYQIHSTIYPIHEDKNIRYFVQVQQDITKRIHSENLKSEFFSILSHELKTPITVLKLLIQTRMRETPKNEVIKIKHEEMRFFEEELDRLTNLVNDMLDASRIEMNKIRLTFEVVNITKLIQAVLANLAIVSQNHKLTFVGTKKEYFVVADKHRIEQVLINFLTNAIKYSPEKETVAVDIMEQRNEIVISVKDNGIGIPKKDQKMIFDKFYQARKKSGFGLGLYISKEIIKRHKGKIWVESEEGKGSTFYFSLPTIEDQFH